LSHTPGTPRSGTRLERRREHERELLARYSRTREPRVLDELVQRFMPLARRLALRYRSGPEPLDDLVQVASLGLVKAIRRFDPDRGNAFTSYAVPTILGELRRHFRDTAWAVHVDRGLQERTASVEHVIAELTKRFGRSPSVVEIATRAELSSEEVLEAIDAGQAHHALSVDGDSREGDDDDPPPLAESLGEEDPRYEVVEYGATIAPLISELSERERAVLHMRFVEDMTQSEIAPRIGVSQMHVSRILRDTLERLRREVPDEGAPR
jgi:RNA polymerase sigma-B factor